MCDSDMSLLVQSDYQQLIPGHWLIVQAGTAASNRVILRDFEVENCGVFCHMRIIVLNFV